jgi:hypothetical protein
MNSSLSTKTLLHRFMLVSAALLIYADNALAANVVGDAQMQARALLTGMSGGRTGTAEHPIATPSGDRQRSDQDPQELARRLILGANHRAGNVKPAVSALETRDYVGASKAARRMILGLGV